MPLTSTRKQPLAIPTLLVTTLKNHGMTLPVPFPLQWLRVSVTDEYKTDGMVAEPHQMDLMGLKLPVLLHRLVSHYAGLCTLILKATDWLYSFVLSCPNVKILILILILCRRYTLEAASIFLCINFLC